MTPESATIESARAGDHDAFRQLVERYRRELKAHCYRMSGSLHDAEDLLQDGLLKAWKGLAAFEGRSGIRSWLYKVVTSACLDAIEQRKSRQLPSDIGTAARPEQPMAPLLEPVWLEPCPDELVDDLTPSPEAHYSARESVTLAFLSALQRLPAKQRAVLILRDVLGWQASECAELLDLSVAAVNSALQRARETVPTAGATMEGEQAPKSAETRTLLARYVQAWEQSDVSALVSLLREDALLSMPPFPAWFRGSSAISESIRAMVLPPGSAGQFLLRPTSANGSPAFVAYQRNSQTGQYDAMAIHVLILRDGKIAAIHAFLDGRLARPFGFPSSAAR